MTTYVDKLSILPSLDGTELVEVTVITMRGDTFTHAKLYAQTGIFGIPPANSITNAQLAKAPANTIKGNASGVTANEADLTVLPTAVFPALTGDVANVAGNLATTIQPNVVSNAKLAQAPANTIKGNATGSTANVADLTVLPTTVFPALTGDVTTSAGSVATAIGANKVLNTMIRQGVARSIVGVTGNATANVADIQGAANQVLVVNGAGTALAFGAVDLSQSAAVTNALGTANGGIGNAALAAALANYLTKQAVTAGASSLSINMNSGWVVELTLSANVTSVAFTNWPATGTFGRVIINISSTGSFAISGWPAGTIWPAGVAPTITSGTGKKDTIMLTSDDGGSTFRGFVPGQNLS